MNVYEIGKQLGLEVTNFLGTFGHSEIGRVEEGLLIKSIEPETLDALPPQEREPMAQHIAGVTTAYYSRLKQAGVAVPSRYDVSILRGPQTRVVAVTDDLGPDCRTLLVDCLKTGKNHYNYYFAKMLESVEVIADQGDVGIDPHPANYAGQMVVQIDFFQVQIEWQGQRWVGFPQPADPKVADYSWLRYCTFEGNMRILRFNVLRLNAQWEESFYATMRWNLTPVLADRAFRLFERLPEKRIWGMIQSGQKAEAKQIIAGLDMFETDTLREIALRVVPVLPRLDELFPLTRLDFRASDDVRLARLREFKGRLCALVDQL